MRLYVSEDWTLRFRLFTSAVRALTGGILKIAAWVIMYVLLQSVLVHIMHLF